MSLDLARRHSSRVHRQNLVIEAVEPALMLWNDLRLEISFPISRHLDLNLTEIALQLLPTFPVSGIAAAAALGGVLRIAKLVGQLGIHRPFNQPFRQLLQQPV